VLALFRRGGSRRPSPPKHCYRCARLRAGGRRTRTASLQPVGRAAQVGSRVGQKTRGGTAVGGCRPGVAALKIRVVRSVGKFESLDKNFSSAREQEPARWCFHGQPSR